MPNSSQRSDLAEPLAEAHERRRALNGVPRTTATRPALLERMAEELDAHAEALGTAEQALRLQNDVLAKMAHDVVAERRRYLNLFGMLPDACLVTDAFGVISEANPAACRLLGSSPRWLIGRAILEHIPPQEREAFRRDILGSAEDARDARVRLKTRTGTPFEASVTVALVSGPDGAGSGRRWLIRPDGAHAAKKDHAAKQE